MLLTVDRVVAVDQVPVGKFFYLKPQGGEPVFAFMAQQVAKNEGDFSGPVVLTFPTNGRFTLPRPTTSFSLAVAAILPEVRVVVDTDDVGPTSTEILGVPAGLLLLSGEEKLLAVKWGELDAATAVNLDTGDFRISEALGSWLSFKKWRLQAADGTTLYTGEVSDPDRV